MTSFLGQRLQLRRIMTSGSWIPQIDGLRFVAIASVLLFHMLGQLTARTGHAIAIQPRYDLLARLLGNGDRGVLLFFVISGTVSMRTPDRNYILEAGDCAYFPGHLSYHMHRIGSEPAIALIAVGRERSLVKRQPASESLTVEGAV